MRLAELSRASGCPISTIKYYLREGLLPAGSEVNGTTAEYDESHVRRLTMVRVLREVGNLSVASVRDVLLAIDDPSLGLHDTLASAVHALGPHRDLPDREAIEPARSEVVAWLAASGWEVSPDAPSIDLLTLSLLGVRQFWGPAGPEIFDRYRDVADELGRGDLAQFDDVTDLEVTIGRMAVGTVVWEQALIALRRLAEENHSRRRFT